jgi:hypothetical protein
MKRLVATLSALAALIVTPALPQDLPRRTQLSPFLGVVVPTGHQRVVLDDAVLMGLTASYDVHRNVAVVGALAWAQTEGHGLAARTATLDVVQYDLGLQGQLPIDLGDGQTLKPFVGVGVGGRTYRFRDLAAEHESDRVGYSALGVNLECRGFVVSATARSYLGDFDGIGARHGAARASDLALFGSLGTRF